MSRKFSEVKAASGLLIVDVQKGFSPDAGLLKGIAEIVPGYRKVVMTKFVNRKGSLYRSVLGWHEDGGDLVLDVRDAVVFEKSGYGLPPESVEEMKGMGCVEWHVCGLETDACVLACAYSLWDAGIRPVILEGLCHSPLHREGVMVARRQFGVCDF